MSVCVVVQYAGSMCVVCNEQGRHLEDRVAPCSKQVVHRFQGEQVMGRAEEAESRGWLIMRMHGQEVAHRLLVLCRLLAVLVT